MVCKGCKIVGAGIIIIALLQAILVSVLPAEYLGVMAGVSRFFEVMIPILAVGALLKYLCMCCRKHADCETTTVRETIVR